MSLFPPYQVSADAVREAAEQSTAGIDELLQLRADVDVEHRTALAAVEGDIRPYVETAPDASGNYSQAIVARLSFARGGAHLFAIAIDKFNTDSGDPRSVSKLNAAYETAAANHFGVDAGEYTKDVGGLPTIDKSKYSGAVTMAKDALIADLQAEYGRLDKQLDEDAAEVAAMLKGKDPSAKDVRAMFEAGALPSYAALLFPDVNFSKARLDRLPTDLRGMSDDQLADYLAKNPGTYSAMGRNLDRLVPGIEDMVGSRVAEELRRAEINGGTGEEELRRLRNVLQAWQNAGPGITAKIYEHLGAEDTLTFLKEVSQVTQGDSADDARSLAEVFRYGLTVADAKWSEEQSALFGRDLGHALEDNPFTYSVPLAFLLQDQHYTTELLTPLAEKIADLDTSPGALDITVQDGQPLSGSTHVVQALFSALGKNGEASLNFFDDPAHQQKYLSDRIPSSDEWYGDLLAALDSATTDEVNIGDDERADDAARLVSSISDFLGREDSNFTAKFAGAGADHLAHIVTTYMAAVDYYIGPHGDDQTGEQANEIAAIEVPGFGFVSDMPVFEKSEIASLVRIAIGTPSGFEGMREGVSSYQNLALQTAVQNGADLNEVAEADGRIEGFFLKQLSEVQIAEAESKDAQLQAWVDLGKELTGAIPMGGTVTSLLGGQALDLTAGQVEEALTGNADHVLDQLANETYPETFGTRKYAMAETLYESGGITQEQLDLLAAQETDKPGETFATPEQMNRWFDNGFPSKEEIDNDQRLKNFLNSALGGRHGVIDLDDYEQAYKGELLEPFKQN